MAPASVTVKEHTADAPPELRILHFNDVYHVEAGSRDPCGGISRFQTLCIQYKDDQAYAGQPELLTFFSGDAFNPSLESSVTKGSHMVPVLNNIGVDCACVGNHDFDFGIPQFKKLTKQCKFPWLLANIFEKDGKTILADCPPTKLVTSSTGIKIGLIGIAEQEWISTVNSLPADLPFQSSSETVTNYAAELRAQGAEMIIALCHQREVNDNRLASEVAPGVLDIILAGHDHDYRYSKVNGCHVLCSGSDFKQLSYIEAWRNPSGSNRWNFNITRRDVTKDLSEHPPTTKLIDSLFAGFRAKLDKPIGYTSAPLDVRFETVRRGESNYSNFVADLLRNYYNGDCAMIVGGTFRGDQVYCPGVIRLKDVMDCFPFEDPDVMISTPGSAIWDALENGVSKYPALEGRFPQVSNIEFKFDPNKPSGKRLLSVKIGGEPLDIVKLYKLVTRAYTVSGGDGFDCLKLKEKGGPSTWLVDEENGSLTSTLLRQYFMSIKVIGKWKNWTPQLHNHWSSVNDSLHKCQPVHPPTAPTSPISPTTRPAKRQRFTTSDTNGAGNANPAAPVTLTSRTRKGGSPAPPAESEPDSESDDEYVPPMPSDPVERERQLLVARKAVRKWRRRCGMHRTPGLCDALAEGIHWTQGIAPRVEGRIRIVGVNA
ncbi:5'-nucleotidase [Myriangium duriaei CBS 260.36]|uniref:5'-nucleotidase n=1 Tax=Myriangium duriaei CBS 260.36 TaxID=1168546 RepID=A0A9P4IV16_9PEZI|nr:5'-nucleotidase [Myriangium duriaei CBS 260.36]